MSSANLLVRSSLWKNATVICRAYTGHSASYRGATYNDLHVPQGDWYEHHQKTQARYNKQLAASVLLFAGVVSYDHKYGRGLNWSRPDSFE